MAFECRLLGVVRLSIIGRFVFLESAIFRRFVWDFSEIWICGLYIADESEYSKAFVSERIYVFQNELKKEISKKQSKVKN